MNKIVALEYLRTLAVFGILICHFCFNFQEINWLGVYCGNTFNALFLMMSALLLGMTWSKKGKPYYGWPFLRHRFLRLSKSYYPFLFIMFMFCLCVGGYTIKIKDVFMHLCYLSWFDKIAGFEHLWFMTMIAICYVSIVVVTRLRLLFWGQKRLIYSIVVLTSIVVTLTLGKKGLPGYMFLYLSVFLISFIEADNIVLMANKKKLVIAFVQVVIVGASLYSVYSYNLSDAITKLICMVAAFSLFWLTMMGLNEAKSNKVVSFIAEISYEIYLIHHIIAFGRFSVMHVTPNWWTGFLPFQYVLDGV